MAPRTGNLTAKFRLHKVPERDAEFIRRKLEVCPFRPIFVSLALCGQVPIQLAPPYFPSKSLFGSTLLYCIGVNAVVITCTVRLLYQVIPLIFGSDPVINLNEKLQLLHSLLAAAPIVLVPFVWILCSDYEEKVIHFSKYQIEHEALMGRELDNSRVNKRNRKITFMIYVGNVVLLGSMTYYGNIPLHFLPTYFASSIVCYNATLWYTTWLVILRQGAAQILHHLKTPLKGQSASHVQHVRKLWIRLRENLEGCSTLRLLIFSILSIMFLVLTLSLYQVIQFRCKAHYDKAISQGVVCCAMLGHIFFLCNESHRCMVELNDAFIRGLDQIAMTATGEETSKAIQLFYLSITAKPAKASLSGFMNCNRPLMTTIVSSIVTYLVVLVQFNTSENP
ncbi:gustatory and odorant receptor 24-like isoform X2 [Thrips palmi]|uniref:Gustatory receptor n=1 Tax=Thrips palmi TaxID=161013 RepID=A0A6P8Z1B6_THRPL|nr:gustatory and odorant receptor 24-like isoform X2 [Thrips palmi]